MEGNMIEDDLAAVDFYGLSAGFVLDLFFFFHQLEHGFHIDQGLFDLAIDHAEEAERNIKLNKVSIYQDEVAHRHGAVLNPIARHDHDNRQADGDDHALTNV